MKKFLSLILVLTMIFSFSENVFAVTETKNAIGISGAETVYRKACIATFNDRSKSGNILLSINSSPDITVKVMDKLSFVCKVPAVKNILPCNFIKFGDKFYKKVGKNMSVQMRLKDVATEEIVWEGKMKGGDLIYLGNDHPDGYIIEFKSINHQFPFIHLKVLDNLDLDIQE